MIRLDRLPHKFPNIRLENCGLLFLSTPHSGTTEADWNKYLVDIAELTAGLRPEIINGLRPFNRSSVDSQEHFATMKEIPPFFCLCESNKTKVGPSLRYVRKSTAIPHLDFLIPIFHRLFQKVQQD